jgi:hypothetical protein
MDPQREQITQHDHHNNDRQYADIAYGSALRGSRYGETFHRFEPPIAEQISEILQATAYNSSDLMGQFPIATGKSENDLQAITEPSLSVHI